MLRTIQITRSDNDLVRLAWIGLFIALTALSAKISVEIGAVPITLQPLVVLLAGMVLGARDGSAALLSYIFLIALGAPIDARGLGTAALIGPTGGYLIGFVIAAFVAGYLVERGAKQVWQRWLAGIVGVAVIYLFGIVQLKTVLNLSWQSAWAAGVAPFIMLDVLKALIAAGFVEGLRGLLLRSSDLADEKPKN